MVLNQEVLDYCNLVCQLQLNSPKKEADTELSKKILNCNDIFKNCTKSTNIACNFLNVSTNAIVKERRCSSAISLNKGAAPLMVTLKRLGDSILRCDLKGCDARNEQKLQTSLAIIEDNHHNREDFLRSISKSNQNLQLFLECLKRMHQASYFGYGLEKVQENSVSPLSLGKKISSFSERDIVASSPIKDQ